MISRGISRVRRLCTGILNLLLHGMLEGRYTLSDRPESNILSTSGRGHRVCAVVTLGIIRHDFWNTFPGSFFRWNDKVTFAARLKLLVHGSRRFFIAGQECLLVILGDIFELCRYLAWHSRLSIFPMRYCDQHRPLFPADQYICSFTRPLY
jgi:hypothetical protein